MLKRLEAKYVRDGIKSQYPQKTRCYISGDTVDLDLHHYVSVTDLWKRWKARKGAIVSTKDDILRLRAIFYAECRKELLSNTVVLSRYWHRERLHKIFGKCPPIESAPKQKAWVERMRQEQEQEAKARAEAEARVKARAKAEAAEDAAALEAAKAEAAAFEASKSDAAALEKAKAQAAKVAALESVLVASAAIEVAPVEAEEEPEPEIVKEETAEAPRKPFRSFLRSDSIPV